MADRINLNKNILTEHKFYSFFAFVIMALYAEKYLQLQFNLKKYVAAYFPFNMRHGVKC